MNRKFALTVAGATAVVVTAASGAMAANVGILGAGPTQPAGRLTAANVAELSVPTPRAATSDGPSTYSVADGDSAPACAPAPCAPTPTVTPSTVVSGSGSSAPMPGVASVSPSSPTAPTITVPPGHSSAPPVTVPAVPRRSDDDEDDDEDEGAERPDPRTTERGRPERSDDDD